MWTLMDKTFHWLGVTAIGAMCLGGNLAKAQETSDQETIAQQYQRQRLAAIDADREGAVQALAQQWSSVSGENVESLAASILYHTTAQDLLAIQDATTFEQVRAIILDQPEGETVSPLDLGDLNEDLVYTPVTPCRIVDTRFGGGGVIPAGGSRNYWVHGTVTSQGGNPAGCPSPTGGDPRAVHLNVTIVPVSGNGFVKVYPKGSPEPNASLVNFKKGTNIANAATIKTCFNCNQDITVKVRNASTHVIIDLLGFYFPANLPVEQRDESLGTFPADGFVNLKSVSIVAPGPGTIVVRVYGSFRPISFTRFGIGTTNNTLTSSVLVGDNLLASGIISHSAYDEKHFPINTAGTYTYYLNVDPNVPHLSETVNHNRLGITAQYIP